MSAAPQSTAIQPPRRSAAIQRVSAMFVFVVPRSLQVPLWLTFAGCFASVCAISLVVGFTWDVKGVLRPIVWTGAITGCLALATGFCALRFHCVDCRHERDATGSENRPPLQCQRMFLRYQIGVGFALLLLGVVSIFVFAGLAHRLQFDSTMSEASGASIDPDAQAIHIAQTCSLRIILSLNMAILGALFFVANSLRKLRICRRTFDSAVFWGGLWYRIGEAVLFTLVFLLVIHWTNQGVGAKAAKAYDLWLPLLALMLGMFIKTGERVVFGLAERLFAAASSMIPVQPEVIDPPAGHHTGTSTSNSLPSRGTGTN